ncbi:MAG: hypothetical protein JW850_21545 [Thermoflexales bacterium]|nr:hypothetical protein [Thermoflexales bacterium]
MPTHSTTVTLLLLGAVLCFGALTFAFWIVLLKRRPLSLRTIAAYLALPKLQSRSIETGQSLHVSLGTAGVGGADTAATLSGLAVLEGMVEEAVASDSPPTITVADPTTLILAQDALRRAYVRQNNPAGYDPRSVHMIAAQAMPYAAAAMDMLAPGRVSANVMIGAFGPEAAMIVEQGAQRGVAQVVSSSNVTTLPLLYPSSDHLLVGEEMFVSGAYIGANPGHVASLVVQDLFRWLLVLAILFGAPLIALLR